MNLNAKNLKFTLKNTALVILGTLIIAFSTAVFILPFNIVVGGVTGLGIIISGIIPAELLTVSEIIAILTWGVFFLGFFVLGRSFAIKTLISTAVYPPALSLFMKIVSPNFLGGFFILKPDSELSLIVSAIFSGVLIGLGCALTFIGGGSTGGTDILGLIIAKFLKRVKSSTTIGIVDAAVVLLGMIFLKNLVLSLLGIITVFITASVIDRVFLGSKAAFVAEIISRKHSEINKAIIENMKRTTTIIDVVGGYSGNSQKMLAVSFSMREYAELLNIINREDKLAFVTIHKAHEINGEGWTR